MSRTLRSRRSRGPGWTFSMASAQAHLLPDLGHGRLGERTDPLRTGRHDLLDTPRVGHQLTVVLPRSGVASHDPVGQHALHVDAAGPRRSLAVPQLLVVLAEERLEL